jgi:hypothetical protein
MARTKENKVPNKEGVIVIESEYEPAFAVIRRHFKGPIRPFMTIEFGRKKKTGVISIIVGYSEKMNPSKMLEILHNELPDGFIAFLGNDRWLGEEKHNSPEIVIARSSSQFDALRLAESRGVN